MKAVSSSFSEVGSILGLEAHLLARKVVEEGFELRKSNFELDVPSEINIYSISLKKSIKLSSALEVIFKTEPRDSDGELLFLIEELAWGIINYFSGDNFLNFSLKKRSLSKQFILTLIEASEKESYDEAMLSILTSYIEHFNELNVRIFDELLHNTSLNELFGMEVEDVALV